ncbi:pilin structural subunit Mtp [Mycobacterium sp.]|uniref:pilin structural subunit Mtp n=1 Tax=Mycobacterium sp. TaxID=1785 RepID=UPI003D6A8BB7
MKKFARFAVMTVIMAAGLGLTAIDAQAQVGPLPDYHWCPGQPFDPQWGPNWDPGNCHDDFHRDIDGPNHSRDFRGPGPGGDFGPGGGGPGPGGGPGGH